MAQGYFISISAIYCQESNEKEYVKEVLSLKELHKIIELFTNKEINKGAAQMLFTSHDLTTMSKDVFRRDEIWVSAINGYDESILYSLVGFRKEGGSKSRNDENYGKQYYHSNNKRKHYIEKLNEYIDYSKTREDLYDALDFLFLFG